MKTNKFAILASCAAALLFTACEKEEPSKTEEQKPSAELSEEWYAGGKLGTTFNASASAYEDPTPAVENAGMEDAFKYGEYFFERPFNHNNKPFNGLGPVYVRNSCMSCHPGYGHGRRMDSYHANDWGNGYLLVVYNKNTNGYETSVAGMPQTVASAPFKPAIDEDKITIDWRTYTDEWGNKFADGESYDLIYPEVNIPEDAFYAPLNNNYSDLAFRLESTIGVYGVGLVDAIPDDSLTAEWARQEAAGISLNPAMYKGGWASMYSNSKQGDGTKYVRKFTYALSRGPLQDAAGANAIWNITNVTRSDRRYHYLSLDGKSYAITASKDADVQKDFYTYFPEWNKTGDPETDIYNYLTCDTLPVEMTDEDYVNFMIWHRGLAVPAARNLDDATVQLGKEKFYECGCATCHRPSWTTGDDEVVDPNNFTCSNGKTLASQMPRYPHQKIWPYSDFVQHRLFMQNDIRTGWCRTTPLWGRGLSAICAGHSDRLHDCRARTVIEAIMWHGSPESDARWSVEKFRQLNKEERDAVVKFIDAI